jgi:putative glutamine amidotransferase
MKKPLIGVTASMLRELPNRDWIFNTNDYFRAVQDAGGVPVLLPFVPNEEEAAEVLDRLDGLLLSGGADIDPLIFGEQPHQKLGAVSPERDAAEIAYTRVALKRDMPVFGVCRGHQVLAVAAGGSLYQDIPAQVPGANKHAQDGPRWFASHTVAAVPGTRLATLMGNSFRVNSYHHQSVKDVPTGFIGSAVAPDGINEALEHPGHKFVLSVQWHPENFVGRDYNFKAIWTAFIDACKG